ncbi:hypothetical protein GUJ93_ZPchr0002g23913 [Zizania palustris]|uniref:Uncharacterized protein n=1 Tax=Zizania palustris TaxID=103762 RepID=A0A8J5S8V9_ZIZPA|nr:hypothetical protein GUJ93_ZPchr0002g23913 [Zizania palustris]
MFATFETVVATAMLVRRFDFQMAPGAPPVEMTTGATIHTTEGRRSRGSLYSSNLSYGSLYCNDIPDEYTTLWRFDSVLIV